MAIAPSLTEYVGADPLGMPPPDLTTVPHGQSELQLNFRFALAFAVDTGGGNFQPKWDQSLTPSLISHVRQSTGTYFVASGVGPGIGTVENVLSDANHAA